MSNSTNHNQLELLVSIMETNPDIATGFTTYRQKEDLQHFWKKTEKELNSLGPPIKAISEWKKVWFDKKKYIRNKIADNPRNKKATGGGQFKEFKFSQLEETIIRICAMRDSVEGCQNATTFGLPSFIKKRRMVTQEKENCRSLETTLDAILESPSKSPVHCRQTDTDTQGS
ncbi:uncharacterized protein LOC129916482 [Episyrphus balteatus]|uniref:uncharacterized protein LOC129916482 n=1 Tax=Episyrphus balteatus TaxID=286459 RepID=UPI0024867761|nr:uncharacterized protein LOC129916482 [Episyrphus balteatus]